MSDHVAEDYKATADANKDNCIVYTINATLNARSLIESAVIAWGKILNNTRAAPSWTRLDPIIEDYTDHPYQLFIAIDHRGAGVLEFKPTPEHAPLMDELVLALSDCAQKAGCAPAELTQARMAFDSIFKSLTQTSAFSAGDAPTTLATFIDEKQEVIASLEWLPKQIALRLSELHSIAKQLPPVPDHERTPEMEALEKEEQANAKPRYTSLGQMVKAGDAQALEEMIDSMKSSSTWNENHTEMVNKLLWHAAADGKLECVKVLIEKAGAELTEEDTNGNTPLLIAAASNNPAIIDYLLSKGASLDDRTVDGMTPLIVAATHNADLSIQKLIQLGCDIDETALDGRTPLHFAALGNEEKTSNEALKTLMDLGADPTRKDAMSDAFAEEYVDPESDESYAALCQYRTDWEEGRIGPRTPSVMSKARSILGF